MHFCIPTSPEVGPDVLTYEERGTVTAEANGPCRLKSQAQRCKLAQ